MVSLEISYYPCLFGKIKSILGIKYRILRDGDNNYYESLKSVPYLCFIVVSNWPVGLSPAQKSQIKLTIASFLSPNQMEHTVYMENDILIILSMHVK